MSEIQKDLPTFLAALTAGRDPIGLVVTAQDFSLPRDLRLAVIDVDAQTDGETAVEQFLACAKSGQWCAVNLLDGSLPPALYNQLRNVAAMGHLQINRGTEVEDVAWPIASRIVVTVAATDVDKVPIPTFLSLFGPILHA